MSSKIILEIVGLYYAKVIEVSDNATVQVAMDEAAAADPTLNFQLESDRSLAWISHRIEQPLRSRTNRLRAPGVYRIDEVSMGGAVLAWQYYIERPVGPKSASFITLVKNGDVEKAQTLRKEIGFKRVSLTFRTDFKKPFESEALQEGDILIWRAVSVVRGGMPLDAGTPPSLYNMS